MLFTKVQGSFCKQSHVVSKDANACFRLSLHNTPNKGTRVNNQITQKTGSGNSILVPFAASVSAPPAPAGTAIQPDYHLDGVTVHDIQKGIYLIRNNCRDRLKYEVEYNLKRGTTDNCYLIEDPTSQSTILIDVPFEAYTEQFVTKLAELTPLTKLTHIVLTQLDAKDITSLEKVLQLATEGRSGPQLQLILSNPAMKLLTEALSATPEKAALLNRITTVVAKTGTAIKLGAPDSTEQLRLILTPTPRWPDMMMVYCAKRQLLFTSKLFSAHAEPLGVVGENVLYDEGTWEVWSNDWRFFYDCMLAPVARQLALILDKLEIEVASASARGPGAKGAAQDWIKSFTSTWNKAIYRLSNPKKLKKDGKEASQPPPAEPAVRQPREAIVASALLTRHGPVVGRHLAQLLRSYYSWTAEQVRAADSGSVAVLYASAYGNTAALAQAISHGVTKSGVAVETLNLETSSLEEVESALREADGFAIGSPTLGGHMPTQVQLAIGSIIRTAEARQLPCGVFGSFGWSGEAVDEMESRLRDAGFRFGFEPIRVKFRPTAKDLQVCEESGRNLALEIKKKMKSLEANVSGSSSTGGRAVIANGSQLAMGRIVGSVCVVTARDEDLTSAMLATWISQASFDPPGVTVAIKKERAMDTLLPLDANFTLSIIPETAEKMVMRRLARPFAPGADRLEGLETTASATTGNPFLSCANSYLDCKVMSRMEAGDHWIIYGTVLGGKVLNEAQTAVHHRKVGNHY